MKKCACKDGRRCPRHLLGDVVFALEKEIEANKTNLGKDLRNFRSSSKPEDVLTALAHVHATVVRASKMVVNRYAIQKIKATLADKKVPEADKIAAVKTSIENAEGQITSGIVLSITEYGFFVDVGGIVGLVHLTQIESSRPFTHPSEVVRPADSVLVRVKRFNPETERLELTMKLS